MAQISRPFQIAFVGVIALAAVWLFALHGRSSSSTEPGSAPVPAVSASSSQGPGSEGTTSVYHGSAPGVAGLTNAIAKAHGAVSTSQQSAKALAEKSAAASSAAATPASPAATPVVKPAAPSVKAAAPLTKAAAPTATAKAHSKAPAATAAPTATSKVHSTAPAITAAPVHKGTTTTHLATGAPANQRKVEAELKAGNVAVLLFWDPSGADDRVVHEQLTLLQQVHHRIAPLMHKPGVQHLLNVFGLQLGKKIAVHSALASQVTSFGTITRGIQIYGTPTILVIGKAGQTTTINGFTDAFGIEQAIDEARL
jgi:hypothetical protein